MNQFLSIEETNYCESKFGNVVRLIVPKYCTYEDVLDYLRTGKDIGRSQFLIEDCIEDDKDKSLLDRYIIQVRDDQERIIQCDKRNRENTISKEARNEHVVVDTNPESAWTHYLNHLRKNGFENIDDILSSSKNILEMLKLSTEPGKPIKGAVVGSVQSGKTANMEALMSLASDNGWNVFIILSGTIDNLRVQTERRMTGDLRKKSDEDPLRYSWQYFFPSSNEEKFNRDYSFDLSSNGNHRYFSVILKNSTHLRNLINNLSSRSNIDHMNLIVIDDEADQASVNTKKEDRTKINQLIINLIESRDVNGKPLSKSFRSVNYICYTATPYAILLNESEGLYPGDFIFALTPSKRYFGLDRIFGSDTHGDYPGMNIIKVSEDISDSFDKLKGHPENMASSMKDCIAWFICCTAVLRHRNYSKPVSLLMNVDSRTDNHLIVDEAVVNYISNCKEDLYNRCKTMYEERNNFTKEDLEKSVWDYGRTSTDQPYPQIKDCPSFEAINEEVKKLIFVHQPTRIILEENKKLFTPGIHICVDNCKDDVESIGGEGNYTGRLLYPDDNDSIMGITPAFIVIGGNTLSRGLTIKGLVATYFKRNNIKQADSLLQMGRWFGYRNGYELLPRIWMDSKAKRAFEALTRINDALLEKIREYSLEGITPSDYKVRIMNVPESSMLKSLTARNKMQGAKSTKLDFSGSDKEFHKYCNDHDDLLYNLKLTDDFLKDIMSNHTEELSGQRYLIRNVSKERVLKFLDDFKRSQEHYAASPDVSVKWLHQVELGSLDDFSVVLSGNANPNPVFGNDASISFCDGKFVLNKIVRNVSDSSTATVLQIKTVRDKNDMIADIPQNIIEKLDEQDCVQLKKGNIQVRARVKEMAGLERTPLLALYVARCDSCEDDVIMAAWYIPKATKSTQVYNPDEYVYLEDEL